MKQRALHLIIYVFAIGIFAACENELSYNLPQKEPQLILNALLDAGLKENIVYLNLSGTHNTQQVEEATVTLYINNEKAEVAEAIPYPTFPNYPTPEALKQKKFRLTSTFNPGDVLRLEAIAQNGKYHASAEVQVPQPVDAIKVDTCTTYLKTSYGRHLHRQYKISLQDRPNETNYYRLEILNDISVRYQQVNENYPDTTLTQHYRELINREDVVLTDGHPSTDEDEEYGELFPYIENRYNIFDENRFRNSSYTLKVYTPLYNNYLADGLNSFRRAYCNHSITVRVLSTNKDTHRYLKALNCINSDNYDETLMEPVSIPTNVKGGMGFVGIFSETKSIIQLPEMKWSNY